MIHPQLQVSFLFLTGPLYPWVRGNFKRRGRIHWLLLFRAE
jgi:hypothetical protein